MKKLSIIVFLNIVALFYASGKVGNHSYPTPGEISIVAATPVTDGIEATPQLYRDVEDCGFNLVINGGNYANIKKQFELMMNTNVKFLVSMSQLFGNNEARFISDLSKEKNFGGWFIKDEPTFDYLPKLKEQQERLQRLDPNSFKMINLVGMIEKPFTGNYKTVKDYISYIREILNPQVWSYDYYPILIKNGKFTVNHDQFYTDLEDFSSMSKTTGAPFWAFCESMEYSNKWNSRPAGTEAYFRFEAVSALAYGAQGIVYWTYGMRKSTSVETYISALVDAKGKKTKAWYAAQKVNHEIKKYNDVFFGCEVKEVRHTGKTLYKSTKRLNGSFGPFSSVTSENSGVLVSKLSNSGRNYIIIVSHDVQKTQKVNLTIDGRHNITFITDSNFTRKDNKITIMLDKGGYAIMEYKAI